MCIYAVQIDIPSIIEMVLKLHGGLFEFYGIETDF